MIHNESYMILFESYMIFVYCSSRLFLTEHKCKMLNYNKNFKSYNKNSKVKNYHQIFIIPSEIVQYYIKFYQKTTHQKLFNTTSDFTKRLHIRFTTYTIPKDHEFTRYATTSLHISLTQSLNHHFCNLLILNVIFLFLTIGPVLDCIHNI